MQHDWKGPRRQDAVLSTSVLARTKGLPRTDVARTWSHGMKKHGVGQTGLALMPLALVRARIRAALVILLREDNHSDLF